MRSQARSLIALLVLTVAAPALAETLPRPPGLEPAVRFWERIYSEVESDGGLIHDSVELDVVYSRVRFTDGMSRRSRERRVEKEKGRIRSALNSLAKGKRSGLSAAEAEVLAAWPAGVRDATLRRATKHLRFQLGQADRFRAGLVRSGEWIDHIRDTLRRRGVPPELAALPHVESSFNASAYSRVGASGLWQFTRSTGRLFMRIDSVVDERLDPFTATDAAARLLVKNYELTRTWPLAITSYNHGAAGMQRAARKLGTRDIATIVRKYTSRTFGFASRNFYASFLAAVSVDARAEQIFGPLERNRPIAYTLIEMPHFYRAASLASALGIDTGTLRRHNGALRPAVWQGSKHVPKGFSLRVPSAQLTAAPPQLLARVPEVERLAQQHRDRYHKVRRGETISTIARRYGLRQSELVALNNLRSRHRIRVGQVLTLPGGVEAPIAVARQPRPADGSYSVRRGDTLSIIGRRFGVTEAELVKANRLRSRHRIYVGQRLEIPGTVTLASAESTRAPAAAEPEPKAVVAPKPKPEPKAVVAPKPKPEPKAVVAPEPKPEPKAVVAPEPKPEPKVAVTPAPEPAAEVAPEPEPKPAAAPKTPAKPAQKPAAKPAPAVAKPPAKAAPAPVVAAQAPASAPDPSDYAVHDGRVTVQAAETLGHYAEWLEVRASQLRAKNGMRYEQPLVIGRRVRLDFREVTPEEFERRRLEYHRTLQDEFFSAFEVTGTESHVLRRGESLWYLAERKYQVPIWLLRQYNPELDFGALPAGAAMVVPVVEPRTDAG